MKKSGIKKREALIIILIFLSTIAANYINFKISEAKSRDNQRNLDVSAIAQGLELYKIDYGFYPLSSSEGKIIACKGPDTTIETDSRGNLVKINGKKYKLLNLVPCLWGADALLDVTDTNYPNYLSLIPKDMHSGQGASYLYISDGVKFQILGSFEKKGMKEYDESIIKRNLSCGIRICNFGKSSPDTPLEKNI